LALRCFEVALPLSAALVYLPIIFFVASLPLTPYGFGTVQATAVHFLFRYAPGADRLAQEAVVLAYSLSLSSSVLLLQALLGLIFLKAALRRLKS
jgi:hypothetical protein